MYLAKSILDSLIETSMHELNPCTTPKSIRVKLFARDNELFTNVILYRSIIITLQYLTMKRPDLAFVLNKLN